MLKSSNKPKKQTNNRSGARMRRRNVPAANNTFIVGDPSHTRFTGTERVLDVATTANSFHVDNKTINAKSFSWLAKVSELYDQYKFHRLRFRYVPFCGTTTQGEVNMSFDFDPSDPAPNSMVQCCNNANYVATSAFSRATLNVPVNRKGTNKFFFVRDGNGSEDRIIDIGALYVCTDKFTAASSPGAVYVDYDVELIHKSPF